MSNVHGKIEYYGLIDWWLSTFTEEERQKMDERYQPMGAGPHTLTQGKILSSSALVTIFLNGLGTWFRSKEDRHIFEQIHLKIDDLGRKKPISKPGYYQGRHYTTYVYDVEKLVKNGKQEEAENLLLKLIDAVEAESRTTDISVIAPWYYEKLAILYRKDKNYAAEVEILERYLQQLSPEDFALGVKPPRLLDRLVKAKSLLEKHAKVPD